MANCSLTKQIDVVTYCNLKINYIGKIVRIAGVDIPTKKKVYVGLTSIYGVGFTTSKKVCEATGVDPEMKVEKLSSEEISRIRDYIGENCETEGDLRRIIAQNIKFLKDIKCYRGLRHIRRLPVRGQRTSTNARTRKGKAAAPVANKKKA